MVDFSSISAVNLNTSTGSTPASGGVQGDSSPVFNSKPKVALLNDDIVAMLKCGLDPNNPQDVQIWQNKSETEKNELRLAYLSSVQEQNDNTETVPEQFIELSPENADSEDVQKQKVFGLLPGNWSEMSLKDKQKYMFDIMGEQKYGESWATKSKKEKRMLIEQDFDTLMYEIEPQYGKMNRKDKEAAMEKAYLKIAAVLQSFESESIVNGEFKAALEDFSAKSREEQRVIIDSVHEELHTEIHHVDELMEHTHDVTLNKHDKNVHSHNHHNDAHRYEQMLYKEIAEDFGVKPSDLTNQQKLEGMRKFKAEGKLPQELEPLHKSLEMQAKLSASGKISDAPNREAGPSLIDIIGADKLITKKFKDQNTGEEFEIVDNTQNTNIQLVNQKVREFKTS
ncbi:hypothetical protein IJZ97_05275 [bacterium]|nr:hypothetical protein [bacterium]